MIWATVSSWSCFGWLYRASPSLTEKNIINLILVLAIWWCPCVESSLVLLEEGVCYDQCVLLAKQLALALLYSSRYNAYWTIKGMDACLGFKRLKVGERWVTGYHGKADDSFCKIKTVSMEVVHGPNPRPDQNQESQLQPQKKSQWKIFPDKEKIWHQKYLLM